MHNVSKNNSYKSESTGRSSRDKVATIEETTTLYHSRFYIYPVLPDLADQ